MAIHVGLFWGIGVFAIRGGDTVEVALDDMETASYVTSGISADGFISHRLDMIKLLSDQRNITLEVLRISPSDNAATPLMV